MIRPISQCGPLHADPCYLASSGEVSVGRVVKRVHLVDSRPCEPGSKALELAEKRLAIGDAKLHFDFFIVGRAWFAALRQGVAASPRLLPEKLLTR